MGFRSAVMVFARDAVEGDWKWGENSLPKVCKYTYLGIDFQCNGDAYIKRVVENGRKKVNQLHCVISNRGVNLSVTVTLCSDTYSRVWE